MSHSKNKVFWVSRSVTPLPSPGETQIHTHASSTHYQSDWAVHFVSHCEQLSDEFVQSWAWWSRMKRRGWQSRGGVRDSHQLMKRSSLEIFTQTQLEQHSHSSGSLCGLFFRTSQSPSSQIRVIPNHESAQPLMSSRTLSGLMQNNLFTSKVILRLSQCHPGTSTSIVRWLLEKKKSGLIPIWMCFRKYSVQPEEEILELWGINKHKNNNIRVCGGIQLTVD